jgi:murein DD-endopeptidase MepM/ murein hydrolase activator NlpD
MKNRNQKKKKKKSGTKSNNLNKVATRKQEKKTDLSASTPIVQGLFHSDAGPGCHIVHVHGNNNDDNGWILGWEYMDPDEYDLDNLRENVPDIAVDPDERTLSVCNVHNDPIVAYVTVYEPWQLYDKNFQVLLQGSTTSEDGVTRSCTTLIVTCPAYAMVHLCYLDCTRQYGDETDTRSQALSESTLPIDIETIEVDSDVQVWMRHPNPNDTHPFRLAFPLATSSEAVDATAMANNLQPANNPLGGGSNSISASLTCTPTETAKNAGNGVLNSLKSSSTISTDADTPSNKRSTHTIQQESKQDAEYNASQSHFLCTQSENGRLTHFFAGNYHAVDFRCSIGTPILAVGNGKVVQVQDSYSRVTGIATSNLYHWNSIMLEIDVSEGEDSGGCDSESDRNDDAKGGPLFVEYVHIQKSLVSVGDVVTAGQVIGTSGSIGFSPEPHLHLSAFRSLDETAATVRVYFAPSSKDGSIGQPYVPRVGKWYDASGE